MKKILLFSLLLFAKCAFGQLTVSGSGNIGGFTYDSPTGNAYNLTSLTTIGSVAGWMPDAGTHTYIMFTSAGGICTGCITYYIFRMGGYWYFAQSWTASLTGHVESLSFKSLYQSTAIDPPCTALWTRLVSSGGPLGILYITISGTSCEASLLIPSASILPNVISLPLQTTAQINAYPLPKVGMIVYDVTAGCMKIYNGVTWKCVSTQ